MKRIIAILVMVSVILGIEGTHAEEYPDWIGFPPMFNIQDITEYNGAIYCACKGGLFRYDPLTQEYTLYYKNHGLLSNNVLSIAATSGALYLGFESSGLVRFDPETEQYEQILFPEYVTNVKTIAVMNIFAKNDSILFIGHKNGLDRLNIYSKELRTFTNLGPKISENAAVNDVKVFKGKIWVCTDEGLAVADEDNPDLEIVSNWKNYRYAGSRYNCIEHIVDKWEDKIFIGTKSDGIVYFDEEEDKILPTAVTRANIYEMTQAMGFPWAASDKGLYRKYVTSWFFYESDYKNLRALFGGSDGNLWVGTHNDGLQYYTPEKYQVVPSVSGPRNSKFTNINFGEDNVLWITTAHKDGDLDALLLRYDNGIWTEYSEDDGVDHTTVDALVDNSGVIWLPSWGKGLFVMTDDGTPDKENDSVVRIDSEKLFIKPTIKDWYIVCSDVTTDIHGNIWIVNHQVNETDSGPVVLDGYPVTKHQTYSPGEDGLATAEIMSIDADVDGWVWLATSLDGVIALYVGENPYDKSDTYVKNLNLADDLLGMTITAVKHDHDGDVWVGTKGGLNRIKKLSGKRLRVDNMNMLLEGEIVEVSCIEVDDYNNKWIGTVGAGLYKLDSQNEMAGRYTPENSGIFSDTIFSLKFDNINDILWVGTDTGLNKFYVFGTAEEEKDTDIHVYPNPFEIWGTNSFVTFANLKRATHVKIYSFNGELVNELIADENGDAGGASVVWNGLNFKGETVGSGVYFYVGTDLNGFQFKDKMVVIRR